jgi:hypothetical protein
MRLLSRKRRSAIAATFARYRGSPRYRALSAEAGNKDEYYGTIALAAEQGLSSGRIYDALILRCAVKVKAEVVFTWNLRHFRAINPHLAARIRTP